MSLPVRERGLKSSDCMVAVRVEIVAPCAGAWIEIILLSVSALLLSVAPCAGAWIEI